MGTGIVIDPAKFSIGIRVHNYYPIPDDDDDDDEDYGDDYAKEAN